MSTAQPRHAPGTDVPWPAESITITVLGRQATQGSKTPAGFRTGKDGKIYAHFREDCKDLPAWRKRVADAADAARKNLPYARRLRFPLEGPLAAGMVFTLRERPVGRPGWWPKGIPYSRRIPYPPAVKPDLSKLMRAVEDALTGIAWADDARVVRYDTLAKHYTGDDAPDALEVPGVVIRIRQIGVGA